MNKTKIEWVKNPDGSQGYTWNPLTGCLNGCSYCYARRLANGRLKQAYLQGNAEFAGAKAYQEGKLDPFYPRFWPERLSSPYSVMRPNKRDFVYYEQKPKGIFVCDMGELFGDWVPGHWQAQIFQTISDNTQHRFYLLTKQPQNLSKWNFPENCWVGVTATGYNAFNKALDGLRVIEAKVKYLSIEPLLEAIPFYMERLAYCGINWIIIGACTGTLNDLKPLAVQYPELALMPYGKKWTLQPQTEWVKEIVEAADEARIPVFQKDNLKPLLGQNLRQEMPNG